MREKLEEMLNNLDIGTKFRIVTLIRNATDILGKRPIRNSVWLYTDRAGLVIALS